MTVFSWAVPVEVLFKLMFMNRPAWQIQNAGANKWYCCRQPELVWINPSADDFIAQTAKFALAA